MSKDYTGYVDAMADKYGVPKDYARAIYENETSSGRNVRTSSAGASGHMQLMPATAKAMGVSDINDPLQNIEGGVKYYAQMLKQFGDPVLAAAAYNAGPGNVRKAKGVPAFRETQDYVRKFVNYVGPQNLMDLAPPSGAEDDVGLTAIASAPKPTNRAATTAPLPAASTDLEAATSEALAGLLANFGKKKTKRKKATGFPGLLANIG